MDPMQPNGFNQPGQSFSPQQRPTPPGQPAGQMWVGGQPVGPSASPQDTEDTLRAQRVSEQLTAAQQQLRTTTDTEEAAMLSRAMEQVASEPTVAAEAPPEALPPIQASADEGELIIRPQQPNGNGNWNGDNNGNSN